MAIHRLQALVKEDFDSVNTLIIENIQSEVSLIGDLSHHIIQSGGKRLRPLLVLLVSQACGYAGREHITLAAMIEFFHTATLLHDDVIDESSMRRGQETANLIWGSKASILVGDFLLVQYMRLMVSLDHAQIMSLLTEVAYQITSGELKQMANRHNTQPTEVDYFEVISAKTSLLFAASAKAGALLSRVEPELAQALYNYGLHLGNAFQLIDDALDYCANPGTLGKNVGDDLADGKATLPLLHALKHGNTAQKTMIRESLGQGTLKWMPQILEIIQETGGIDYTRKTAYAEMEKALFFLQKMPDSVYKEALETLAQCAVQRSY